MVDLPHAFALYNESWNEPDPQRRDVLLERCVSDDVVFADPVAVTHGRDALAAHITDNHAQMPGASYDLVSGIDGGHDRRYRYRWIVRFDDADFIEGMDFTTLDADGRIARIDGFFGDFPTD